VKNIDRKLLQDGIREVLSQYFENLTITAVHVAPELDRDGEEILRVDVVFEGSLKGADARRAAGAARHIRPVLEKNDADLFPFLSFVSKVDYDRGRGRRATH
jgi:hypothetical protein